jgi:hypothetical protein
MAVVVVNRLRMLAKASANALGSANDVPSATS